MVQEDRKGGRGVAKDEVTAVVNERGRAKGMGTGAAAEEGVRMMMRNSAKVRGRRARRMRKLVRLIAIGHRLKVRARMKNPPGRLPVRLAAGV